MSAKTFDMTSGKYASGITYTDPDSGVGTASDPNCYNYKYDASTGKIIGGNVKVESNNNGLNFYTALRISKSDLAGMNVTDQKKVLRLLAEKYITSSNVYADWDYATKKYPPFRPTGHRSVRCGRRPGRFSLLRCRWSFYHLTENE